MAINPGNEKKGETVADLVQMETDYRVGIKSLRQIAEEHGLSEGAIRKRAKKMGWERDLSGKVQAKADDLVRKEVVRTEVRTEIARTEKQIIDVNAQVVANVRLAHRKDIERLRKLVMQLSEELFAVSDNQELFTELAIQMRDPDEKGQDKRFDLYMKVIDMSSRTANARALSEATKTLIGLERQAFGITDGQDESKKTVEDWLDTIGGAQ
jgi:hypothetical protein